MNILLMGYGKMGQAIEKIATEKNHTIAGKINTDNRDQLLSINPEEIDVAIEFSQPDAAFDNILFCIENNIPVVSGTTGWLDKKPEIEALCTEKAGAFFYASNYSIGVNLFFKLNAMLAKIMKPHQEYEVEMEEIHHTEKKDSPSGTAITLAEGIIENLPRKNNWLEGNTNTNDEIQIKSLRIDKVPGTHTITYTSDIDDIEIKHTAHSRKGFATGAVLVAEWIKGKTGNLTMDDFMNSNLEPDLQP